MCVRHEPAVELLRKEIVNRCQVMHRCGVASEEDPGENGGTSDGFLEEVASDLSLEG